MAEVDIASVYKKVTNFAGSNKGKAMIKNTILQMRKDGKERTALGYELLTEKKMNELAEDLIDLIKKEARLCGLADSVMKHFESLQYKKRAAGKGRYEYAIYFTDNLHRDSLDTGDQYTGEGIDNIVALFNNGYSASDFKYGWWNGHNPTGWALSRSNVLGDEGYAWVRSVKDRESLRFIQAAVSVFEAKYAGRFPVSVTIGNIYDD